MFVNYHRHTQYSNVVTPDSPVGNSDYAKRAVELGHTVLSGVEHGWCGRYIEGYTLAKEYGLRFLFGVEAYIVKDRFEKDPTNAHIVLLARNENGRRGINRIISEANVTGFYYKARIDLPLLFTLSPNDVWVTSACVGGLWKYDDHESIFETIASHFGSSFFFEVQPHHTEKQNAINKLALGLSKRLGIRLIAGCDSHYIYPEQSLKRDDLLASKHIQYEDEEGWFMDYPDEETLVSRFKKQGVLPEIKIREALESTRIFESVQPYSCGCFDDEIKMPSIYPNLSEKEKMEILRSIVFKQWEVEKEKIENTKWSAYEQEIEKELSIIETTKHADYFLLNHMVAKRGQELGGLLTLTGRGSGVSFYVNYLLGFTKLDRIAAPVRLYPERFMSAPRMLEAKTLADFDFNVADPEPFYKAQQELLGKEKTYPMISFGTLKTLAAWKAYARSKNVDPQIANDVSKAIQEYEAEVFRAQEYSPDDEVDVDPLDFIPEEYRAMVEESKEFLGTVVSAGMHPCAFLIYPGNIPEEIGIMRVKDNVCAVMDGLWAETAKCLKNDLLTAQVVEQIYSVLSRIGQEPFDVSELMHRCQNDDRVWNVYRYAWTVGINQVEKHTTSGRVAKFSPKNLAELSAFVAAIRPGFKSYYHSFESRSDFSYGVSALDSLIQTPDFPFSYMLYQENAMAVMAFAGIPIAETYEVVKNIAKKRVEKVLKYKGRFLEGMAKRLVETECVPKEKAQEIAHDTWQVIEDSSRYSFNASHAFSVAADSAYGAYLKSHYPLDFYASFMEIMERGGHKDRIVAARTEAEEAYGIHFPPLRFGQDNRGIVVDRESKSIISSIGSLKGFGAGIAEELYELGRNKYKDFIAFLVDATEKGAISKKFETLIQINYFNQFGGNKKLLAFFDEFVNGKSRYTKNLKDATKAKRVLELAYIWNEMPNEYLPVQQQLQIEESITGSIKATYPSVDKRFAYVLQANDFGGKYAPRILVYSLATGKMVSLKTYKKTFSASPLTTGDIIYCHNLEKKFMVDGRFVEDETGEPSWWLIKYSLVNRFDDILKKSNAES